MPLLKTRSTREQFAQNHVLTGFGYFYRWRFHKFPVLWFQCLTILTVKKFLYIWVEIPIFQFTSISRVLSLLLSKSLALSVHSPPVWVIYTHDKISPNGLLQLNNSSSWWIIQSLKYLGDSTLYSLQYAHIFFVFRNPELIKRLKVQAHIPWLEGNKYFPQLAVGTHSQATKNVVGLLCQQGTLMAHVQLHAHEDHQGLFCKAVFQPVSSQPVLVHGFIATQV